MRTLTVEASQPDAEKACLMTPDEGARRKGDLDSLFSKVVENRQLDEGQILRLQGDPDDLWRQVLAFIEEEKVCCPFFSFEARELPDGVELTISGARLGEVRSQMAGQLTVIRADQRDASGTATPGMDRAAGVAGSTAGAKNLWMGYVTIGAGVESGVHHHGTNESGIYIISGNARFRFGDSLETTADAGPGDFIHVPPHVVHQEINLSQTEPVEMIVARDSQEGIVVNVVADPVQEDVGRRMWR